MSEQEPSSGYTVEETASRLGIEPDAVRGLIAAGTLTAVGAGDELRVSELSVFLYLAAKGEAIARRVRAPQARLAVASDVLLPLLLTLWFMTACVLVFSLRGGKPIAPLPAAIAVLAAALALSWWLARQATDFSSIRGVGTSFHGRRATPEGRVGTQWMTFAGVPLLPVRSYVILEADEPQQAWVGSIRTTQFRLRPLPAIHWPQALPVMAAVWAGLAGLVALALRS